MRTMSLSASWSLPGLLSLSKGAVPVEREAWDSVVTTASSVSSMSLMTDLVVGFLLGCTGAAWFEAVDFDC